MSASASRKRKRLSAATAAAMGMDPVSPKGAITNNNVRFTGVHYSEEEAQSSFIDPMNVYNWQQAVVFYVRTLQVLFNTSVGAFLKHRLKADYPEEERLWRHVFSHVPMPVYQKWMHQPVRAVFHAILQEAPTTTSRLSQSSTKSAKPVTLKDERALALLLVRVSKIAPKTVDLQTQCTNAHIRRAYPSFNDACNHVETLVNHLVQSPRGFAYLNQLLRDLRAEGEVH